MTPVAMPGIAAGRTWRRIVCHWVAPSASEPSRIDGGTARSASRAARITIGRTSRVRVMRAGEEDEAEVERAADDEGESEDAVDDRGHGGEVLDVELDQPVPPASRLSAYSSRIDRRTDADRDDEEDHARRSASRRADDRRAEAGLLAVSVEGGLVNRSRLRRVEPLTTAWISSASRPASAIATARAGAARRRPRSGSRRRAADRCSIAAVVAAGAGDGEAGRRAGRDRGSACHQS